MLVVEVLGSTTTILYGLNILFDPVHEDLPKDPDNPGLTMVGVSFLLDTFPETFNLSNLNYFDNRTGPWVVPASLLFCKEYIHRKDALSVTNRCHS